MNTNTLLVIFGASGDLTHRKLIPALYGLFVRGLLPEDFAIVGVSRTAYDDQSFAKHLRENLTEKPACFDAPEAAPDGFCHHVYYQKVDTAEEADFHALKARLALLAEKHQTGGNVLYYLATPPSLYASIAQRLHQVGMNDESQGWKRLIVEKPFGYDTESALALDAALHGTFAEHQIYRIDHYLGKETVQNLLVFRFSNTMFEPLWSRNYIERVEITAAESLGVEGRGGYYEGSGAVRDMLQNHLLQVLAIMAMEPPSRIDARCMRDETVKVMQCFRPLDETALRENLVLGQYLASELRDKHLPGYREEPGVAADSRTETYLALKMFIDNWRWNGVPFYLRTGKRLPTRATEIVLYLRKTPHPVFAGIAPENKIIIRIQPDEGILINFGLKHPGAGFDCREVGMDFHYQDMEDADVLDAYQRLLLDAIKGDATLFARSDAVHACWEFVQPILDYKHFGGALYGYAAGTWGPKEADELLAKSGYAWRFPCKNLTSESYCEL